MLRFALFVVMALAPLATGQGTPTKLTYPDVLRQMTDLDQLWQPPHAEARCFQFASFEPDSKKGLGVRETQPGDPKGWYANHDRGHYLREETRLGKKEWVMADCKGPGAIVRIWSANPAGTLFFYVDGAKEPTWSADFKRLTHGEVAPFTEPLAGMRARGCNFHAPIPFARHIKITCSENDQYYQVNVRRYPQGTEVESFRADLIQKHAGVIAETRALLANGPKLGKVETMGTTGRIQMTGNPRDPSDHVERGIDLEGPLVVRELSLMISPPAKGMAREVQLRRVLLSISFGGRRTVHVPVADFFGSAPGFKPYRSYPMEVTADGRGICRFPIPVPERARIALVADGPLPKTSFNLQLAVERRPVPKDALTFRASWHLQKRIRTRPLSDFRVLNARGPGRFVGCALTVANPSEIWWGEGDEKFFVDGESFPSTFGTGTEDYFGYAWCDRTLFASAYHAQPQCDGPRNFGYTCVNRFQIPDAVPFQRSFLFDLEIWHWRDVYVDYATTAWWYGKPGAKSGLPSVPSASIRTPDPVKVDDGFVARGAVEGENMKVLARSGGESKVQWMGGYDHGEWSNARHRWWLKGKMGDKLVLAVPVAAAGRYRVEAVLTRARDYGIVQLRLNGAALGEPVDLFTPHAVEPTKRLTLGEVVLEKGESKLELEITGKHADSVGYMAGLDYVRLVPVPRGAGVDRKPQSPARPGQETRTAFVFPCRKYLGGLRRGGNFGKRIGRKAHRAFAGTYHLGEDTWLRGGTPVVAVADGREVYSDFSPTWTDKKGHIHWNLGNVIVIEHELRPMRDGGTVSRVCSVYVHLGADRRVKVGDSVKRGDVIGVIGKDRSDENGRYPAHLHFGLHRGPYHQISPAWKRHLIAEARDPGLAVGPEGALRKGEIEIVPASKTHAHLRFKKSGYRVGLSLLTGSTAPGRKPADIMGWCHGYGDRKTVAEWIRPSAWIRSHRE